MSRLSTHVLDLTTGRPAAGMTIRLERLNGTTWTPLATTRTDDAGRVKDLLTSEHPLAKATYKLTFETTEYFGARGEVCFYPHVVVTFEVQDASRPCHVPLLLSPYGYSTYRGS